jgi:AcrR family transcriptional regulator
MDAQRKPRKIYLSHRENQRDRILEAAENLFIRNSIDNVTIAQVAASARISRVTLYEYFPNKQEIAWAIFKKVMENFQRDSEKKTQLDDSGYEKVEQLLFAGIDGLETHAEDLRFIALFNFLYAREGSSARMRNTIEQARKGTYRHPAELIREGIADGSIRPDIDPDLTAAAINNLLAGLTSRFALLGANVQEEYRYSGTALFREICRIFLRGIRSA